jgi:hypothetical protein
VPLSSSRSVLLFAEAMFTSAYVRFSLSFLPFKTVMKWLGSTAVAELYEEHAARIDDIRNVQAALARCHNYALWKTECYTLALTGKIMLRRRHINSTLYIGFRKDENNKLCGHAWLTSANLCITGNTDISQFSVHSVFS